MIFIKTYWFLIVFFVSFIGTSAVAQYRLGHVENETDKTQAQIKEQSDKIIIIIKEENKKIQLINDKNYAENKLEINKLKAEQKNQTVLRINQQYIREDMKEIKTLVKELAKQIRRSRK